MRYERLILRLAKVFLMLGLSLGAIGALMIGTSAYMASEAVTADAINDRTADCELTASCGPIRFTVEETLRSDETLSSSEDAGIPAAKVTPIEIQSGQDSQVSGSRELLESPHSAQEDSASTPSNHSLVPRDNVSATVSQPTSDGEENVAQGGTVISETLPISAATLSSELPRQVLTSPVTTTVPISVSANLVSEDSYTSTAQVHARSETSAENNGAGSEVVQCPTTSSASFDLVAIAGPWAEHPDSAHGDFNITLRGYALISEARELVKYNGATDPDAPQLSGLFQPNRAAAIKNTYRVNEWNWDSNQCDGMVQGCVGPQITDWDVTLVGLATTPGEPIGIPERGAQIFSGGYRALVLYAGQRQITLGYTRRDTVATGYVVHILDICVDPNLLALYQAQINPTGKRSTGLLPALRTDQILGIAPGDQIKVAIRDRGSFMDPRSSKDWWRGY
jgi:hypothetical protein